VPREGLKERRGISVLGSSRNYNLASHGIAALHYSSLLSRLLQEIGKGIWLAIGAKGNTHGGGSLVRKVVQHVTNKQFPKCNDNPLENIILHFITRISAGKDIRMKRMSVREGETPFNRECQEGTMNVINTLGT